MSHFSVAFKILLLPSSFKKTLVLDKFTLFSDFYSYYLVILHFLPCFWFCIFVSLVFSIHFNLRVCFALFFDTCSYLGERGINVLFIVFSVLFLFSGEMDSLFAENSPFPSSPHSWNHWPTCVMLAPRQSLDSRRFKSLEQVHLFFLPSFLFVCEFL